MEDRLLAVEDQVVGQLAGDDVGQEPHPRPGSSVSIGWESPAACTTRAGVFRPNVFEDEISLAGTHSSSDGPDSWTFTSASNRAAELWVIERAVGQAPG